MIRSTEGLLFGIGMLFTVLICLEVVSRFVFDFSIFWINALARFLLIWFFFLGAGLALRKGGHVGFELIRRSLPAGTRRAVGVLAQIAIFAFFCMVLWGGLVAAPSSLKQVEPSLGVSALWAVAAIPVGALLLIYHQIAALLEQRRSRTDGQAG